MKTLAELETRLTEIDTYLDAIIAKEWATDDENKKYDQFQVERDNVMSEISKMQPGYFNRKATLTQEDYANMDS